MPNPSHPRSSIIKWGKKINIFIDRTKSSTRTVNRLINLSSFMYTVENLRTFAEIIITVHENIRPIGSKINVNTMGVDEIEKRVHSNSIVVL